MPRELGYFQSLTVLDLRNSALVGLIPADICESGSLNILQLDGNSLMGQIPEEIGNCSSLYLLSLAQNNLSEIPQKLGILENLLAVNISYNKLVGRLPVGGIFPSLDQSALQGNLGICSPLLKGPCKMNVPKPLVLDPYAYGNQGDGKLVLFDSKSSPDWISNPEALLNKAAEIGQGVFGTVYKVSLGSEARMVAIKKLFTPNIIQYPEDFDREVQVLGKARHPNLLSLKGYYWTPQLQLLVSEYAPNGSLQAKLHETIPSTPLEYGEDNVLILNDHVRFLLEQGNVLDCVDPGMGDYPEDEVLPVLKLALVCTSHIPSSRPSMAEVVQILQVIKTPVPQRTEFF
ncbi:hypothetical protein OIU85_020119 [Salix viminalis]|uniref:Protein kinase domain-containing protein n=1 Tax=Salix viminalis TaxID=40686 RepID=A0A9Q0ZC85_SALVM|nr:hypothetical protein OIU85_020119 [Salix viminalis]